MTKSAHWAKRFAIAIFQGTWQGIPIGITAYFAAQWGAQSGLDWGVQIGLEYWKYGCYGGI
jgi:hypothetical protein